MQHDADNVKDDADLLRTASLADPAVQQQPDTYHHALHTQPLYYDKQLGIWICSTYQLMREILRNTEVFSSVDSQSMDSLKEPPAQVRELRRDMYPMVNTMVTNDPPDHTRIRSTMDPPFRSRAVGARSAAIAQVVNDCIDEFVSAGQCEFVSSFAVPIPVRVIADVLGLPHALADRIKQWSDAAVEPLGMMISEERHIECTRLTRDFQQFFAAELEARRSGSPGTDAADDVLTQVANARMPDGEQFSMAQMLSITSQLLVAGNETTTNAIGAGMRLLIDHPDEQARLRAQPELIRGFANEVLRLEAPVQGLFRVVKRDVKMAGVQLRAGDRVMCRFAAANRDPAQYEKPDRLDVTRRNTGTNLAFGAGIHHCLGANLAREEMVQSFAALLQRLDNLAFVPGANNFAHHPSMILRGLKALHISWTPAGAN